MQVKQPKSRGFEGRGPRHGCRCVRGVCCPHCETDHQPVELPPAGFYSTCKSCGETFTWEEIRCWSGVEYLSWSDYGVNEDGTHTVFK